jgi:hypothetical protein
MKKSAIFLLGLFYAISSPLFATEYESSYCAHEQELNNLYPTLVRAYPDTLLRIDFDFLNTLKSQYENLSIEESNAKDLTHNEILIPLARHWSALFIQHESAQGTFFAQEIDAHLHSTQVSLDWISLLPMRFAAAISSAPSQEEIAIYNGDLYDNALSHTAFFEKSCWSDHKEFKKTIGLVDLFKNITLFRPVKKTPTQLVPKITLPIMGEDELNIPDMVLMNLDNIFPIGVSFKSHTEGVHGTNTLTSLGFLLHDLIHCEGSHSSFLQQTEEAPEKVTSFLLKKHNLNAKIMKFFLYKAIQNAEGNFKSLQFRKMILALFLGNHESDSWPQELYRTASLDDTVDTFCAHILTAKDHLKINGFEDKHKEDVAGTSVFDGKIYLADAELFKRLRQHHLKIDDVSLSALKDIPGDFVITKSVPHKIEYTATLDNQAIASAENTVRYTFISNSDAYTLHYRLKDARGLHTVLRYAGLRGVKPLTVESLLANRRIEDLSTGDTKDASAQAITYLHTLARSAAQVVENFKTQAKILLTRADADFLHRQAADLAKEMQALGDMTFDQ